MAVATLSNEVEEFGFGKDSKVIIKDLGDIAGGRTLDIPSTFTAKHIEAGHIIIKTSAGEFQPLGVTENAYDTLPSGASYVGVLKDTILTARPLASILTMGQVNKDCVPYEITSTIATALPNIQFM